MANATPRDMRIIRHRRVRATVAGSPERPRLSVFRSLSHIYAQIVDDSQGKTLVSASTVDPEVKAQVEKKRRLEQAHIVGAVLAQRARQHGITKVVMDRGGYQYHGRVKALAEAARKGGLSF
ncbi:MAG: 50S ribosomal protein L18 [Chloroflexi bacterium]|nr:50S ribosomal protein L18 [Chloroflexota bacterium]